MPNQTNKKALYMLMFNMFITMGGVGLIIPILPLYLKTFDAGGTAIGALIATFSFAQFLVSPLIGQLSDRYGRKLFIIIGLLIYSLSMLAFGLSEHLWLLFLVRFLSGVGAAFITPPIMAYVADITTLEERGKGMGMIGASITLGFTIGPGLGGILSEINLTFPIFFAGICAFLAAVISIFILPDKQKTKAEIAVIKAQKRMNLLMQLKSSTQKMYFVFLIVVFTFSFGVMNLQSTLPVYLTNKFEFTPLDTSMMLTVGGILGVLIQLFIIDKLFKKFGELNLIIVNLFVAGVTTLLVIFFNQYAVLLIITAMFSISTTLIRPAVNSLISKVAGNEQGYAAGMNSAYMSLGNVFGPLLAGILYDWKADSPYFLGLVILVICGFVALQWAKSKAPHLLRQKQS